VGARLRTR